MTIWRRHGEKILIDSITGAEFLLFSTKTMKRGEALLAGYCLEPNDMGTKHEKCGALVVT